MIQRLIRSKPEYYALAARGLAGNSPRIWTSASAFCLESEDAMAGLRMTKAASGKFRPYVPRGKLRKTIQKLGLKPGEFYISEILPPDNALIAGEVGCPHGDWVFYYTYQKDQMRKALVESGQYVYGRLAVWGLLGKYCSPSDVDDLHALFDLYSPGGMSPIIELTAASKNLGMFPHRNTLIWEIRHY